MTPAIIPGTAARAVRILGILTPATPPIPHKSLGFGCSIRA
jgi:hypothetical protein